MPGNQAECLGGWYEYLMDPIIPVSDTAIAEAQGLILSIRELTGDLSIFQEALNREVFWRKQYGK